MLQALTESCTLCGDHLLLRFSTKRAFPERASMCVILHLGRRRPSRCCSRDSLLRPSRLFIRDTQRCNRADPSRRNEGMVLQPLHCSQEKRWVTTNLGPACPESGPAQAPIQDVNACGGPRAFGQGICVCVFVCVLLQGELPGGVELRPSGRSDAAGHCLQME